MYTCNECISYIIESQSCSFCETRTNREVKQDDFKSKHLNRRKKMVKGVCGLMNDILRIIFISDTCCNTHINKVQRLDKIKQHF